MTDHKWAKEAEIISNVEDNAPIHVKRFHLPGLVVKAKCPTCGRFMTRDFGDRYESYPSANEDYGLDFNCDWDNGGDDYGGCGVFLVNARISLKLELVPDEDEDTVPADDISQQFEEEPEDDYELDLTRPDGSIYTQSDFNRDMNGDSEEDDELPYTQADINRALDGDSEEDDS